MRGIIILFVLLLLVGAAAHVIAKCTAEKFILFIVRAALTYCVFD